MKKVFYISDGAGSQYKNRFNFQNLCLHKQDFGVPAEWHIYATSHGKRPCDGLGGTFKRAAAKASLQRPLENQIVSVKDLVFWAKNWDSKILIEFIPQKEILENKTRLADRYEDVKTIDGTISFHSFEPVEEKKIRVRRYSYSSNFKDVNLKIKRRKPKT